LVNQTKQGKANNGPKLNLRTNSSIITEH